MTDRDLRVECYLLRVSLGLTGFNGQRRELWADRRLVRIRCIAFYLVRLAAYATARAFDDLRVAFEDLSRIFARCPYPLVAPPFALYARRGSYVVRDGWMRTKITRWF